MAHIPNPAAACQPLSSLRVDGVAGLARRLECWLLPPRCVLCLAPGSTVRTPLAWQGRAEALLDLCAACHAELPWLSVPATQGPGGVPAGVTLAYAPLRYAWPVAPLVHALKYRGERLYGRLLATTLAEAAGRHRVPLPECWVPVPLHRERERQRGFNQSADLAARLVRETGVPVSPISRG